MDSLADILENSWSAHACWADPAGLVEVEDASMSLLLEVLGLVERAGTGGRGGYAGVVGVDVGGWNIP